MGDQTVSVRVLGGKNLIPVDRGGTSDPYCIASLGNTSHKTKVKKKTLNPDWSDDSDPFVFVMDARSPSEIEFEVLDWNRLANHKRMGKTTLALKELANGQEFNQWLPLRPTKEGDKVSGDVHISAQFRVVPPRMAHNKSMGVSMFLTERTEEETPLFSAIRNSDIDAVKKLIADPNTNVNEADQYGYFPLHAACVLFSERDDEILTILLRHKDINVNVMNKDNNTPLHYFCQKFRSPNCSEAFDIFLEKGANANAQNNLGETPLHKAILNNNLKILMVNLLIKAKVEINKMNNQGETPLHYVVRCGREDLVSILLKAGAETDIRGTKEKKTPYELAVEQGYDKIANILVRAQELFEWLEDLSLEKYYTGFLKEEMYKELLPDLDEKILYRVAPNMPIGNVTKILNAAHALRDEQRSTASKDEPDSAAKPDTQTTHDIEQELEKLKYVNKSGTWILHNSELEFAVKLGSGTSGTVYKGLYKSEDVAIKVLKSEQSSKELEEFKKEFQIMSSIQSPYLVFFFGAVLEPKMCMVMELCSRGSLYHVLFDSTLDIGWERMFSFSKEMIKGVDTLHSWTPQVVHRDLKSLNLMVNELWHVKVADFGLSRFNTDTHKDTLAKMRGTYAYCAPEVYFGESFSDKADIYSTAIILWELVFRVMTREYLRPYQEFPNLHFDFQIIIQTAKKGVRPTIPEKCPESLVNVIKNAWSHEVDKRPTAKQFLEQIEAIEQEYLNNVDHWNSLISPPKAASE